MAEKKNVRIRLFKDNSRYKGDLFVSVNGVNYKIRRGVEVEVPPEVAEVLEHLTVFVGNCDLHNKSSFLYAIFSFPILTDCGEIGKDTRAFCAFWSGKHSRYVKMISETAAKCIIIEPEKRVQV